MLSSTPVQLGRGSDAPVPPPRPLQLLQHLKRIISDLCKLYNLPQHPDVEMLDQPLPAEQVSAGGPAHTCWTLGLFSPRGGHPSPVRTVSGAGPVR